MLLIEQSDGCMPEQGTQKGRRASSFKGTGTAQGISARVSVRLAHPLRLRRWWVWWRSSWGCLQAQKLQADKKGQTRMRNRR
jgi:hypothetical protein